MSWANYDDVCTQLIAAGIVIDGPLRIGTDKMVRCKVDSDHERRGWYRLFELALDNGERLITGSFGVWRGDDNGAMKVQISRGSKSRLDADQMAAIAARQKEDARRAAADLKRQHQVAAAKATRWWAQCEEGGEHVYLNRKGLRGLGLFGARRSKSGNLVIPMQDGHGGISGLQVIYADPKIKEKKGRDKDFTPPGLEKKARWFQIGSPSASGGIILVAEGYATGASLHQATGLPVAVAFDAGNLLPVGQALDVLYRKRARILFCADDDYLAKCRECNQLTPVIDAVCAHCGKPHGKINTGCVRAEAAAAAVSSGAWVAPVFESARPLDKKGPTDFNDLHTDPLGGLDKLRLLVETSIAAAGWKTSAPSAPGAAAGGAGERQRLPSMLSIDDAVARFSLVYGGVGTLFDHIEHMLVPKSDVLDILPEHGWRDMRAHKSVVRLSEVGFDPAETDPGIVCNLWGGWPTTPAAGSCKVLLELLEYLCSGENNPREVFQWVLKWLAYPVQHPGAKMRTALIFHGPQGAGKNLFFEAVMQIYGEYGRIVDQSAIEDKFNDWASRKLFLIADEVVARAELFHVKNKLKGLVTGEWIRINPKNVAAHDERNHVNLVFLSNEHQPLVLDKDDRRYTVIWTPDKLPAEFYGLVRDELNAGGIAALHQYLLDLDLGDFDEHTKPPMTDAKRELIDVSMGSAERFVVDWKSGDAGLPFCPCSSADLYTAYLRWCRAEGIMRPRENQQFISQIGKMPGWFKGHKDRYNDLHFTGKTVRCRMVLPSEADLTESARAGRQDYRKPEHLNQSQWLTEGWLAFNEAISDPSPHGAHA